MKEKQERALEDAFTVRDLIAALKKLDPDLPVFFAYPSKNYWRDTLAGAVTNVREDAVAWSSYSESMKLPRDEKFADDEEPVNVVIID